jgi:hypothetical protein
MQSESIVSPPPFDAAGLAASPAIRVRELLQRIERADLVAGPPRSHARVGAAAWRDCRRRQTTLEAIVARGARRLRRLRRGSDERTRDSRAVTRSRRRYKRSLIPHGSAEATCWSLLLAEPRRPEPAPVPRAQLRRAASRLINYRPSSMQRNRPHHRYYAFASTSGSLRLHC